MRRRLQTSSARGCSSVADGGNELRRVVRSRTCATAVLVLLNLVNLVPEVEYARANLNLNWNVTFGAGSVELLN